MFTHCVKPALTTQQAKELFALLGYQPAGIDEQELRLSAKPVYSRTLLHLACGFFTARIECQLLLAAVASLGDSMERVLQVIQERKLGCTFQIALDGAKGKLESAPCDAPLALDATLDLYTDDSPTEHSHMASPPSLPYIPPGEDPLPHKLSRSNTSQSNKGKNEKAQTVSISSLTYEIKATPQQTDSNQKLCENERQFTAMRNPKLSASKEGQRVCYCLQSYYSNLKQCLQCGEIHSMDCPCFRSCIEQGHKLYFAEQHMIDEPSKTRQDETRRWEKTAKDDLKLHSYISKPSNDFFFVCHNCHYIHDAECEELQRCYPIGHIVQSTGTLQPPQLESKVTAHTCFKVEDTNYVVCHACNKSHDLICNDVQNCRMSGHNVSYVHENNEEAAKVSPMPMHQCCTSTPPNFACLTCRVFHTVSCDDNQCQRQHDVQRLQYRCCTCSDTELYILCRYCCAQHCKNCWFKNPLDCRCGMSFVDSAV